MAALPAFAQHRVALVIGNDAYQSVPALRKAANDARAVGEALTGLGFDVTRAENLTQRAMSETFARFDAKVQPGDTAFFFFAGHGFEIRGLNYLLPTDVPAAGEGQDELVRDAAVAVDVLIERLHSRGAGTAILVLDACRDNPFEQPGRRGIAAATGLAPITPPEGVFVLYSAGAKQEALDELSIRDRDPNSVFTRLFVQDLRVPGLSLVQLAKRTQVEVRSLAATVHHDQIPAYYDQIVGDVVLSGTDQQAASPRLPALPQVASLPAQEQPLGGASRVFGPDTNNPMVNGPLVSFSRSNVGWQANISLPEPAISISWRFGDGPFQETGLTDDIDQRTGRRRPNSYFALDPNTPGGTVELRYVDPAGMAVGPFRIAFEPQSALAREQRRVLTLVSYRCAVSELKIGLDTPTPDRVVPLPPCDEANPFAIPTNFAPYLKAPADTHFASVQIRFRDGSASPIKLFQR